MKLIRPKKKTGDIDNKEKKYAPMQDTIWYRFFKIIWSGCAISNIQ